MRTVVFFEAANVISCPTGSTPDTIKSSGTEFFDDAYSSSQSKGADSTNLKSMASATNRDEAGIIRSGRRHLITTSRWRPSSRVCHSPGRASRSGSEDPNHRRHSLHQMPPVCIGRSFQRDIKWNAINNLTNEVFTLHGKVPRLSRLGTNIYLAYRRFCSIELCKPWNASS